MRPGVLILVAVVAVGMPTIASANIFEYLWADGSGSSEVQTRQDNEGISTCDCAGPACQCCVDFNLTYIDLGGPGCVQMEYISQEEGIKLNVSYGDSLLHSQHVKGPKPNATCMALLTNIADICARFSDLLPHNDGLRGCLLLEPKLLGAVTTTFRIGCFTMGPKGMILEQHNTTAIENTVSNATDATENQNESEIINGNLLAVVNETAEQGLAFLGNLLGLAFSETEIEADKENSTTAQIATTLDNSTPGNVKK